MGVILTTYDRHGMILQVGTFIHPGLALLVFHPCSMDFQKNVADKKSSEPRGFLLGTMVIPSPKALGFLGFVFW